MTTATVLQDLRVAGVRLVVDGQRLLARGPRGAYTPELRAAVAAVKPDLLAQLRAEGEALAALVDRCGKRWSWLLAYADELDPEAWEARRNALMVDIDAAHALLVQRGETAESYGWTVTDTGTWHRSGEEPPPDLTPEIEAAQAELIGEWRTERAAAGGVVDGGDEPELAGEETLSEVASLRSWVLAWKPPAESFVLHPGVTVHDGALLRRQLLAELPRPGQGRDFYGAVQDDARAVRQQFGPLTGGKDPGDTGGEQEQSGLLEGTV